MSCVEHPGRVGRFPVVDARTTCAQVSTTGSRPHRQVAWLGVLPVDVVGSACEVFRTSTTGWWTVRVLRLRPISVAVRFGRPAGRPKNW